MNDDASFGNWVTLRRKALHFTRAGLAERVGCAVVTLRKIEADERRPSEQVAERLADSLHLSPRDRAVFIRAARGAARVDQLSQPASPEASASDGMPIVPAAPVARRHRLPHPLTTLIGRESQLDELRQLLTQSDPSAPSAGQAVRLITLIGPPGIGKTRLALQAAIDLSDAFPDGMAFVQLASIRDSQLVLPTIAHHLNVPQVSGRSTLEQLVAYLGDLHFLLALDNFEQVAPAAVHLVELLSAAPHLKLLVTSRVALHLSGERRYAVPPLVAPDAHMLASHSGPEDALARYAATYLFLERTRDVAPGFAPNIADARAIAQLCKRLDGLPLAIELAAARMTLFSPQELLARLDRRLAVLTDGALNLPERQRTLRNAIQWSYDLLDAEEQAVFRRLGVFSGGWTLEAAARVAGSPDLSTSVIEHMQSLINKSVVKQEDADGEGETRFNMLETLREYALERLEEKSEAEAVRQHHAAFFVELAERTPFTTTRMTSAERKARYVRFDIEQDNCRAALGWALATHHAELGLRLVGALGDYWFWWANRWDEGWSWISQFLALPEAAEPTRARAYALRASVKLLQWRGEYAEAIRLADDSLALFRALGDKAGMAWVLVEKAWAAISLMASTEIESLHTHSLELFREMGDQRGIGMALWLLAGPRIRQGRMAEATALLEEGITAMQTAGDDAIAGQLYSDLGYVSYYSGDYARAAELLLRALTLCREGGDADGANNVLVVLANVLLAQGDIGRAAAHLEASIVGFRRAPRGFGVAFVLPCLGYVRHLQGDDDAARALLREALVLQQQRSMNLVGIELLERCAWVAADLHQPQRAARLFGVAEATREQIDAPLPPGDKPLYDRHRAQALADLDEPAFDAAWSEGRAMTLDEAVAYALAEL